jgi:hypothetical protein
MTRGWPWRRLLAGVAWLSALSLALSAWAFAARHAIAVPMADAWDFITTFLEPVATRGFAWTDLFVQRGGVDHSQPLQKLVLYAHWRWADLDFRVEALVGQAFSALALGGLGAALFHGSRRARTEPQASRSWLVCSVALAVSALALFSMNSSEPLTWSLVSLGWMYVALSFAAWWLWLSPKRVAGWWPAAFLSSFLLVIAFDEAGMVSVLAGALALVATAWGAPRPPVRAAVVVFAGAILGRIVLESVSPSQPVPSPSLLDALRRSVEDGSWTTILEAPLLGALVHRQHWSLFGLDGLPVLRGALTVGIALLHLGFWWFVARRARAEADSSRRLRFAVAVMLFSYGCWAGAVVARIPDFGADYLWQPRYLMFFQLQWAAFALAWAESVLAAPTGSRAAGRMEMAGFIAGVVLLVSQLPLQAAVWATGVHVDRYAQGLAEGMRALAMDPGGPSPSGCPAMLTPCAKAPAERDAIMAFLVERRLSLFSPAFLERHAEFQLPSSCAVELRDWGPKEVIPGEGFNVQPDGQSAFWIAFGAPLSEGVTLRVDGREVAFQRGGEVISFMSDPAMASALEADGLLKFSVRCAGAEVAGAEVRERRS